MDARQRLGRGEWRLGALVLLGWLIQPAGSWGADIEYRDFTILVDGKNAGQSRMIVTKQQDGTTIMVAQAQVRVQQGLFKYTYTAEARELWKDGRLVSLKTSTNDNGKRFEVAALAEGKSLRLRVNNQDRPIRPDVWTTSFWKLADPRFHNKGVPLLEADTGREYAGQLQYLGTEQLTVANQPQPCYHFRVVGGSFPVDLWFDRSHLLVRQEFTDQGHRTQIHLSAVGR